MKSLLSRFSLWKTQHPMTFFLRNSGILQIYNLSDFQNTNLFEKAQPRTGKTSNNYIDLFQSSFESLYQEYDQANQRDKFAQEKLSLLPAMIIHCLRQGKVTLAIEYNEEHVNLCGGLVGLKKKLAGTANKTQFMHPATLPALNLLSLKFLNLPPFTSNSAWTEERQQLVIDYRACTEAAKLMTDTHDILSRIGNNFSNVSDMLEQYDKQLINECTSSGKKTLLRL